METKVFQSKEGQYLILAIIENNFVTLRFIDMYDDNYHPDTDMFFDENFDSLMDEVEVWCKENQYEF